MRRIATNVPGLDVVLNGGLEPGSVVVVAGAPGTGKTVLGHQICFANATAEHKCVYYSTVSEPHSKLVRHLEQFAFFDSHALGDKVEHIHLGAFLRPGHRNGLEPLVKEILRKAEDEEPAMVVIDSAKMLREFADESQLRAAFYDLTGRLPHTETMLVLVGEYTPDDLVTGIEFAMADCIVQLEYQAREPVDRRWLRIVKMRGGSQRPGKHTFQINASGIQVFPRIETLIPAEVAAVAGRIKSGIPGLDAMMGGGMNQGDASLILGPSGVGKTIFGLRWIAEALEHGEHCLYVTFQDTADQLVSIAADFGWDLGSARESGQLVISQVPLGNLDLDVLADAVRAELARQQVDRVVIDNLAEMVFANRESERLPAYERSLVGLIRAAGGSLLVNSETSTYGLATKSMGGLMFLFDNVLELRYIEQESEVGRAMSVVKMRNSRHAMSLNQYTIGDHGVTIGAKLEGVTGVLGWSALRAPDGETIGSGRGASAGSPHRTS